MNANRQNMRSLLEEVLPFVSCNCGNLDGSCEKTCTHFKIVDAIDELKADAEEVDSIQRGEGTTDEDCVELDYETVVAKARESYAKGSDDDIEIDDDPLTSRGDRGCWVQAWVYVAYPLKEEE